MGCSTSLAKMILFVFNIVFFLFGAASLGIGIWITVSRGELFKFINLIDARITASSNAADINAIANQHGLVQVAGFALIGLGVFTLLVGFCGCCGAIKESKCLLFVYSLLVSLVLATEAAAAVLAFVFQTRVQQQAESSMLQLQDSMFVSMTDYLVEQGGDAASTDAGKKVATNLLNYVQVAFQCCGAQTAGDISNSSSWQSSNRTWNDKELLRPITCCRMRDRNAVLNPAFDWWSVGDQLLDPDCPFSSNVTVGSVHVNTCYHGIMNFVASYAGPLIGVCIGIAVFELIGVIMACHLRRSIKTKSIIISTDQRERMLPIMEEF